MLNLSAEITIGNVLFEYCADVQIQSSIDNLTQLCTITMPRRLRLGTKNIFLGDDPLFKKGDEVEVKLGYNDELKTVFKGFLKNVNAGVPVVFECEDYMYLCKQHSFKLSYETVKLADLIQTIKPTWFDVLVDDISLGKLRINEATPAKTFEELKSIYGLSFYFRLINNAPTLVAGLRYTPIANFAKSEKFVFQNNIIQNNLEYRTSEFTQIRVKATSICADNSRISIELPAGVTDGELRTFNWYNKDEATLTKLAQNELDKLKFDGYRGSFITFGEPLVDIGDIAQIEDEDYPERAGNYLIRAVTRLFGRSGYRQVIYLDNKAA